jgi:hypothetical protein
VEGARGRLTDESRCFLDIKNYSQTTLNIGLPSSVSYQFLRFEPKSELGNTKEVYKF